MDLKLKDKVVLVTGGTGGIGTFWIPVSVVFEYHLYE